jgi:hypothetical protein
MPPKGRSNEEIIHALPASAYPSSASFGRCATKTAS